MQIRGGDLLIAPAAMRDPRFHKTVILITHHHEGGSYGLCLNRPTSHTVQEVIESADLDITMDFQLPVYWGGPVSPGSIWMLHSAEWQLDSTQPVNEHWSMTSHSDMFYHLADHDLPRLSRIFSGFSSWGPKQLNMELESQGPWARSASWLLLEQPEPDMLFDQEESQLWTTTVELSAHQAIQHWL